MGRKYTVTQTATTVTAANTDFDLVNIKAPTDAIVRILSIFVGQSGDAGDAEAELLRVQLRRGQGTFTESAGGALTPAKHEDSDGAATVTATGFNATPASAGTGTLTTITEETFNVQAGWYYTPTPEEQIILRPTIGTDLSSLIVHVPSTVADDLSMTCRVTFEEVG